MTRTRFLMVCGAVLMLAAGPAMAYTELEDFESGGFGNPVFSHTIDVSRVGAGMAHSGDYSVWMLPDEDIITFNLAPGQYVDYAAVWTSSNNAPATFEVTGTLGTYTDTWFDMPWHMMDTSGAAIGEITQIRLHGFETTFDDIEVNVAPEPATLALLGLGSLALLRRRR